MYSLVDRLFQVPTSSASSERVWSVFSLIHSKKRSRLGNEKVVKLSYIYINSNLGNSIEDSTTTAITAFSKSHEINRIDYCSQQITHSDLNDYISSSEEEIE